MKHEIRFTLELSDTDYTLLDHMMEQDGIKLDDFAKSEVASKIRRLVCERKADVGRILAMTGQVDDLLRIESAKLAEARKSPW